ncbi:MAG: hypothetical protein K2W99_04425 [Chthoniobacterales bacterium]|nr:hypothetical protein [Chthoniobacterales bacterium]
MNANSAPLSPGKTVFFAPDTMGDNNSTTKGDAPQLGGTPITTTKAGSPNPYGRDTRELLTAATSFSDPGFKNIGPKLSVKKVNPRAEITSVVNEINFETNQLIKNISEELAKARETYLKIAPPLERTSSKLTWNEQQTDRYSLQSTSSKHQVWKSFDLPDLQVLLESSTP